MRYTRSTNDSPRARLLMIWLSLLAALVLTSCNETSGDPEGPTVSQRVSQKFGHELLSSEDQAPLEGHETMMRLVKEYNEVETDPDGRSVMSIDGRELDAKNGTRTWASFVNGIETDPFPSEYKLYPGDLVQWDLRDWYITLDVRATVGAFPEFFTRGFNGELMPVWVRCEDKASTPCRHVKETLRAAGVKLGGKRRPTKRSDDENPFAYVSRVLVGKWSHWRDRPWPDRITRGPRYSGIFARFSPDSDELRLLDWNAHFSRAETGDVGLVAAMRPTEQDFMWMVTGTTDKGVMAAARALDRNRLRDAYALAVLPDGDEKLPVEPR